MTPFQELSRTGKLRRLTDLARSALDAYGLAGADLRFHQFETNALYRVTGAPVARLGEERLMLRLAVPGWRTRVDLESEAMWLDALARDIDVGAPRVVRDRAGRAVVPMTSPNVDDVWHATLMTWVPGRLLGTVLTPQNLARMGELFAVLHLHGADFVPPDGFTTRVFDRFLSRGEPEAIFAEESRAEYSAADAALIERLAKRVNAAYAAIDRGDLRVIHCDLWHDNIKVDHGRLRPFDFEDTVRGFRSHDIAMAMLDLLETVGDERYRGLLASFRSGYTSILCWPDDEIDVFQVGRILWQINWVARRQPEWLGRMVGRLSPTLTRFEREGRLTFT